MILTGTEAHEALAAFVSGRGSPGVTAYRDGERYWFPNNATFGLAVRKLGGSWTVEQGAGTPASAAADGPQAQQ